MNSEQEKEMLELLKEILKQAKNCSDWLGQIASNPT
jgi:ferritin-like metal-binding protein YciE